MVTGAQSHSVEQREPVRLDHHRPEQLFEPERDDARGDQREHVQLAEHRPGRAQSGIENRRWSRVRDRGRQEDHKNGELGEQGRPG